MIIIRATPPKPVAVNTPVQLSALCGTCGDAMNFGFDKVSGAGSVIGTPEPRSTRVVSDVPGEGTFRAFDEGEHVSTITVTWFGPPSGRPK